MDRLTVSSAESRLTSDTYNINQLLARIQRLGVRAPILLLGGVVMMLGMEPVLALVLVFMLPAIALIVYFVTKPVCPSTPRSRGCWTRWCGCSRRISPVSGLSRPSARPTMRRAASTG